MQWVHCAFIGSFNIWALVGTGGGDHSCKSNRTQTLGFLIRAAHFRLYPSSLFCSSFQMATPNTTSESQLEGNRWKRWKIQQLRLPHFFLSLFLSWAKSFVKIIYEARKRGIEMKETGKTLWQRTFHKSPQLISKQKPFTNFLNQISNCWSSCFMIIK